MKKAALLLPALVLSLLIIPAVASAPAAYKVHSEVKGAICLIHDHFGSNCTIYLIHREHNDISSPDKKISETYLMIWVNEEGLFVEYRQSLSEKSFKWNMDRVMLRVVLDLTVTYNSGVPPPEFQHNGEELFITWESQGPVKHDQIKDVAIINGTSMGRLINLIHRDALVTVSFGEGQTMSAEGVVYHSEAVLSG